MGITYGGQEGEKKESVRKERKTVEDNVIEKLHQCEEDGEKKNLREDGKNYKEEGCVRI